MSTRFWAGVTLGTAVTVLFLLAGYSGMAVTGLEGPLEVLALALGVITAPAAAVAPLVGRLVMAWGTETAFWTTGVVWAILCVPYAIVVERTWLRLTTRYVKAGDDDCAAHPLG